MMMQQILPKKSINVFFEQMEGNKLVLGIENFGNMPVEIKSINHENNRSFGHLKTPTILMPNERKSVSFALNDNFQKLFINKKKNKSNFDLSKDLNKMGVSWKIYGTQKERQTEIKPWSDDVNQIEQSLIASRSPKKLPNFPFLEINEPGRWLVDKIVRIPAGYTFTISPGTEIDFKTLNGQLISFSPVQWKGTSENPIKFTSQSNSCRGIFVAAPTDTSVVEHCFFENLSNPALSNWGLSGAVNFYESPVKISNTVFKKNRCEDALNIIKSWFSIDNVAFSDIYADAFDGDFVEGSIRNSTFNRIGNDGIDVSGSIIEVKEVTILEASDKGLSAGENSQMIAENILIQGSEVAVACKDLSSIEAKNLVLKNNALGFTAFQKKSEFGPCQILAQDIQLLNNQLNHLIEVNSSLKLNGDIVPVSEGVKERMYGAEFGKSSR